MLLCFCSGSREDSISHRVPDSVRRTLIKLSGCLWAALRSGCAASDCSALSHCAWLLGIQGAPSAAAGALWHRH
ncbi:hypothetical protein CesoFtcFv8_016704 [Champsocephalus esox]|uniref:Uncharacterized protein n=1 Tax=Champsocephalus esox TaxID=159716 RepID=A0AAN8BQB5_9TELE|nr:hypothetical protein CesoFtcFv8_016704 [Champsocephalus esox]